MFKFETQSCCTCHSVVLCSMNHVGKQLTFICQSNANVLNKTYDCSCTVLYYTAICRVGLYICWEGNAKVADLIYAAGGCCSRYVKI